MTEEKSSDTKNVQLFPQLNNTIKTIIYVDKMTEKKGKTHEFKGNIYTEIPKEIAEKINLEPGEDLEFKNPYKDLVILVPNKSKNSKKTEKKTKKKKTGKKKPKRKKKKEKKNKKRELGPNELKVLKKLGKMKHWERTPEKIEKELNEEEGKIFEKMLKGKVLFKYEKEGENRIGIDREYFPLVTGKNSDNEDKRDKNNKSESKTLFQQLEEEKHMVIENRGEVEELQRQIREKDKVEEVKGVRDFDKKFYIIKKDKLEEIEEDLEDKKVLDKEKSIEEIAEELGIEETLSKASLVVLREEGKVVEKGKNIYQNT